MTTATQAKTKTIYVELHLPITLELEVESTDTETILNKVWEDFTNTDSKNTWNPDYTQAKDTLRGLDTAESMDDDGDCYYLS